MVKLEKHPNFLEVDYENETLIIKDKKRGKLIFSGLPIHVYNEFEESGFSYSYLENNIINNPKLSYKKKFLYDGELYDRE